MTLMGLFDIFRSRPPIRDSHELAQFIDENAAFLVQKGIYEYARARAGHYAKVLFKELMFAEAVERSRWTAYPLGLAMVGELVEGVLRPLLPMPIAASSWRRCGRSCSRSSTAIRSRPCSARRAGAKCASNSSAGCS